MAHVADASPEFISQLADESAIPQTGFFDIHELSSVIKQSPPKLDALIDRIKKRGHLAARAHYTQTSIKTTMPLDQLKILLKKDATIRPRA